MIIVEGGDCVGKTTFAKALARHLSGFSYRHHTKPSVHAYQYFNWFLADTHPHVIVDRLHWSAHVYGTQFQTPENKFDPHQWRYLELAAMSRASIVLLMYDDPTSLQNRWQQSREMYKINDQIDLDRRYTALYENHDPLKRSYLPRMRFRLPALVADSQKLTLTKTGIEIAEHVRTLSNFVSAFPPASLGVGNTSPNGFLILGEALSDNIYTYTEYPRFAWDWGKAPDMLWEALDKGGIQWWKGYYTNASAFPSLTELFQFINKLQPHTVITLGGIAERNFQFIYSRLTDPMKWVALPHPAYIRRFQRNHIPEWKSNIQTALSHFINDGINNVPEIKSFNE